MQRGVFARTLSRYEYLGRHDKVGQAVASGQYDAGALSKSTFKKLVRKGFEFDDIRKAINENARFFATDSAALGNRQ